MPVPFQQLWIKSNTDLSGLGLREDLFDGTYLKFFIEDIHYEQIKVGNESTLETTARGDFLSISLFRKGYKVLVTYSEANLKTAIELITKTSLQTDTLIETRDYLNPEAEDYSSGYTVRKGIISARSISSKGAIVSEGIRFLLDGFSFDFIETGLRYV